MQNILRRTTYIVSDIEKTVEFYRDCLGLNLLWQTETTVNGNLPIGCIGDKAKFVAFNGEDPTIGMVAFMEVLDSNAKKIKTINKSIDKISIGDSILVLGVNNCEEVYNKLIKVRARIYKSPFDNSVTGRDGKKIKMISMFAWDPNNIFLEINQRL